MAPNEKKFLNLIEQNGGMYDANDRDIAEILKVSVYSVAKYKRHLRDNGYIDVKLKHFDGKMRCFYRVLKHYDEQIEKDKVW